MAEPRHEIWDIWYPAAAAQGLPVARGRLESTDMLLIHAAPDVISVDVFDDNGRLIARGRNLERTSDRPMARLRRRGETIEREDLWPTPDDAGRPVILPGGEVGILQSWWNAEDGSEWRWQVAFYNCRS